MAERERSHTRPLGARFVPTAQVLSAADVQRALVRMAHEVAERNGGLSDIVLIGLQTGGVGLAYRIAESGYRLNIPRMFAALLLLSVAGIAIFYLLTLINYLSLRRWHESALDAER